MSKEGSPDTAATANNKHCILLKHITQPN